MFFDPYNTTVEKFEEVISSDKIARQFFEDLRWGGYPQCPHCGSFKSYPNGCGTRYKCGGCSKKYSVAIKSLLNYSKISLRDWLLGVFIYQKSRKQILTIGLASIIGIRDDTAYMMKNRLDIIFEAIPHPFNKNGFEVFKHACMNFFILKDAYVPSADFKKNAYHIDGVLDLSNRKDYDRLLLYTKRRLWYCKFITVSFLSPEEILNDAFIALSEYPEQQRNDGQFMVKVINRRISRLWYDYQKGNYALNKKLLEYQKEWKEEARLKLKAYYIAQVENVRLKRIGVGMITTKEIKGDNALSQEIRNRIVKKRKRKPTYDL